MIKKISINSSKFLIPLFILLQTTHLLLNCQQLSEIMFCASESNCEFIEIFNPTDSILCLNGYKIKYHTSSSDQIISADSNYLLGPHEYALIFEGDYNFENGLYKEVIPRDIKLYRTDDNSFGSSGMSNSSDRIVYLIDSAEDTIDVYTYSANNDKGYSDERKYPEHDMWGNSINYLGTPGRKNSISPFDYDLGIAKFFSKEDYVIIGGKVDICLVIQNYGELGSGDFTILIENEKYNQIIYQEEFNNLNSKDSLEICIQTPIISEINNYFVARILHVNDEVHSNNEVRIFIKGVEINEKQGDIVINEIMYAPKSTEPEWIEIFNISDKNINLKKYKVADNSDTLNVLKTEKVLLPNEYLVFADDSSIINSYYSINNLIVSTLPTLNNSGDKILLLDSLNRVIDSLTYSREWGGNNGLSLEKIVAEKFSEDFSNWGEAIYPTPGEVNSISQKEFDIMIDTLFTIPHIPLIDSSVHFVCRIKNVGKSPLHFRIELFQDTNKDSITDHYIETSDELFLQSGEVTEYIFEYQTIIGSEPVIYSANLNIEDDFTVNNSAKYELNPAFPFNSIVINEIHYAPLNTEPEWIELFNKSKYDINLKNWSLSDILTTPVVKSINEDLILKSKSYLVITKDNSILEFHRNIKSIIYEMKFANLNNDEDGIVLIDNHSQTMDSVKYLSSWVEIKGRSLERINVDQISVNENNWNSSIDLEYSTPGRVNSITPKYYDLCIKSINTNPVYPVQGENIFILLKIINYGKYEAENFSIEIGANSNMENLLSESIKNISLSAGDSLTVKSSKGFKISDTTNIVSIISFKLDEDENNNILEKSVIPGFNSRTVLINEVMFKPNDHEPEWIEIFNNTDSTVNMINWMIADSKDKYLISNENLFLESEDYIVLSNGQLILEAEYLDTFIPNLGNLGDEIILYDFRNSPIDSLSYKVASDFPPGTSLERINVDVETNNPNNWIFSLAEFGSTPGLANSVSNLPDNNYGDIIFTEIMFDPSESNSEFIELFNNSDEAVEIGSWKLINEEGEKFYLSNTSHLLYSGEYFVISADTSILNNYSWLNDFNNLCILNSNKLNLTNSGKKLYLADTKNYIIDSIFYSELWHNSTFLETKNISLELINNNLKRTNGSNWSSSVSPFGGTPGKENSINVENLSNDSKLDITPNPFSPDNDGFEDYTFINYNLTEPLSQIRIRIYDSKGRFIKTIANNQAVGSSGSIIFDGLDKNNNPLKIGIYIILFEAVNLQNVTVEVIKDVVVVARKL